jgi:ABC-type Na+ efflux pump permease subunit
MKTVNFPIIERLRITWVIAIKDMREAVKNKNTLTVIAAAFFIVAVYRLVPDLTSDTHAPELIVYAQGASRILAQVEAGDAFYLASYPEKENMLSRVAASEAPYLGLEIPRNFDELVAAGHAQELQGYTIYWASAQKSAQIRQAAEAELTRLAGVPVRVKQELVRVYPEIGENSLGNWAALALVFVLMMISIQLIPNLMLEEKNARTLDALLVSPVSAWELAGGKAIAGMFYLLLAAAVTVMVFYASLLYLMPALLAILLGGLFMVLVGLWTGLKVESRGQLSIVVLGLIGVLFLPVLVYQLSDLFAGGLGEAVRWLPGNLVYRLVQAAFARPVLWGGVAADVAGLLAWTLVAGAGLIWQIRRLDRVQGSAQKAEKQTLEAPVIRTMMPEISVTWKPDRAVQVKPQPLHIFGVIALKDLREALKNKVILSILLTSLLLVVVNSGLPLLLGASSGLDFSTEQPSMIGILTVIQLMVMGIALTPVLFVEEKETHTLEALLASPARPAQIVGGKAVVGVVYGLLAVALILLFNGYLFVRWDLVILALLASLAFSVALGLFLGACCENPATLGLWGGVLVFFLIATTLASAFESASYPAWLSAVLRWLPGNAMLQLLTASMSSAPDLWHVVMYAGLLLMLAALLLGLTIRKAGSWR